MSKFTYLLFITIFYFSCIKDVKQKKEQIFDKKTDSLMVNVLTDIYEIEALKKSKLIKIDNKQIIKFYNDVLKKHKLTKKEFKKLFNLYLNNPKHLEKIYKKVLNKLSEKDAMYRKL